jgi:phospholipid transport system transporter-binding protein
VLTLPPELTQTQASACLRGLMQDLRALADAKVLVDAAPLGRFDSAALAVLLELRRNCLALGKGFSIQGMPARLAALAALYGVAELLLGAPLAPVK